MAIGKWQKLQQSGIMAAHTLDISVEKKQVTSQQRSQHSQQNYHKNLGLRKTLHPPKSTRLKLP